MPDARPPAPPARPIRSQIHLRLVLVAPAILGLQVSASRTCNRAQGQLWLNKMVRAAESRATGEIRDFRATGRDDKDRSSGTADIHTHVVLCAA